MRPFQPWAALRVEQREMIRVDLGNEQRDVLLHPVVARVADDDVAGLGERALDLAGDRRIETGEHQLRRAARRRRLDDPARHVVGQAVRQSRHAAASRNALPSERWLAPSHSTLNHGWLASSAMNCWPTMPVAPRMPTGIGAMRRSSAIVCVPSPSKKKADAVYTVSAGFTLE